MAPTLSVPEGLGKRLDYLWSRAESGPRVFNTASLGARALAFNAAVWWFGHVVDRLDEAGGHDLLGRPGCYRNSYSNNSASPVMLRGAGSAQYTHKAKPMVAQGQSGGDQ